MNISVDGTGDILSILPDIQSFFKYTQSESEWKLQFSGSPGNVQIAGGDVKIRNGMLKLGNVAPEIKNIDGHILFDDDGFIRIHHLNGTIKDQRFQLAIERHLQFVLLIHLSQ